MSSLFTTVTWPRGRAPRRTVLLDRINALMPWQRLSDRVLPVYSQGLTGRKPYPLNTMLRVYVLQWVFQLSDESTEDLILDSHAAASFAGIDPWEPRPPGATAVRTFRQLIEQWPGDQCRKEIARALQANGAEIRTGQIKEPVLRQPMAKKPEPRPPEIQ